MRKLALTTAALIGLITPALAEQNSTWKDLQHWHIGIIGDTDDCFMMTSYAKHQLVLRFTINRSHRSLDMMFTGEGWNSLQAGEYYQMSFQFGNNSPWSGPAQAFKSGSTIFLGFSVPNADFKATRFADEMSSSSNVVVSYAGRPIANWNLNDSSEAFNEMLRCEAAMIKQTPPPSDPFATKSQTTDPFRPLWLPSGVLLRPLD